MPDTAISIHRLSKQYHIGGPQKQYNRLGEQLADALWSPFRRAGKLLRGQASGAAELDEQIWALQDVSFDVRRGEVVGIIGRNGAGKSTLLKILSRITEPTAGYVDVFGRVGSLLEVGTGFHPELTGRENVFLNGAILGMNKQEILRKFDAIVSFAEIEKFIDTPVKHYSSGMYVRLAFAVAAHLEPEILIVDEVLAVGDVAFQKKCLGKMDDVAQQGRTVLFVSHNLSLIQTLCDRGIFLHDGLVAADGPVEDTVRAYLQTLEDLEAHDIAQRDDRRGRGQIRLVGIEINGAGANGSASGLATGAPACFNFHTSGTLPGMACTFVIHDHLGQPVVSFKSALHGPQDRYATEPGACFVCDIDELYLMPGRYRLDVSIIGAGELQDALPAAALFDVAEGHLQGRPMHPSKNVRTCMPHRWTVPA